jgi:hypothetical protein
VVPLVGVSGFAAPVLAELPGLIVVPDGGDGTGAPDVPGFALVPVSVLLTGVGGCAVEGGAPGDGTLPDVPTVVPVADRPAGVAVALAPGACATGIGGDAVALSSTNCVIPVAPVVLATQPVKITAFVCSAAVAAGDCEVDVVAGV